MSDIQIIQAVGLSGKDIGKTISFGTRTKRGIKMTITAELRQVYHNGAETVLDVGPHDRDNEGGDLDQFTLEHTQEVVAHT